MTAGLIVRPGDPGYLAPGSDEWSRIITPSKVAAILGVSRWESPYRLWHRMKGLVEPEPPKDAFDIGHDMEPYAANRWVRRNPGWHVSTGEVQYHVPAGHFPFPAVATIDRLTVRGSWRRVLEAKVARNLSDQELFGDDLTGECPDDYAAQVTAQRMFCAAAQPSGVRWLPTSHLIAIGPYFNDRVYEIEYDLDVAAWMIDEVAAFWRSLADDVPPPLDDSPATYACVKELHPDIEAGAIANVDPDLAAAFLEAKAGEKAAKAALTGAQSRLLDAMQSAQYAQVGTLRVADRRNTGKGGVALYAGRGVTPEDVRHMEGTNE